MRPSRRRHRSQGPGSHHPRRRLPKPRDRTEGARRRRCDARVAKANVEIDSIIGDGNKVATLLRTTGETTDGKIYNPKGQPGGCIFYVNADEISEIRLFLDNTMVEAVLLDRQYLPPSQVAEE